MERTGCIMMNIPIAFFLENKIDFHGFVRYYQVNGRKDDWVFNHFISSIPRQPVTHCFLCFGGYVRMRVNVVEFLCNKEMRFKDGAYFEPRNWMVATGPVTLPPVEIPMKGFRGFRYSEKLF